MGKIPAWYCACARIKVLTDMILRIILFSCFHAFSCGINHKLASLSNHSLEQGLSNKTSHMQFGEAQRKKLHFVRTISFRNLLRGACTKFGNLCPSRIQRVWRKMKKWANFGLVSANIQRTLVRQQERKFFRRSRKDLSEKLPFAALRECPLKFTGVH